MLPVDEFLPIMFDQHVNGTWKRAFEQRNLVAWSASPLIVFPTHYTGEDGYISDTEDSVLIKLDEGVLNCLITTNEIGTNLCSLILDSTEPRKEKKGNKENYSFEASVEGADQILLVDDSSATLAQQQVIYDAVADSIVETLLKEQNAEL